jgi:tellurite resistance protein TerC
VALLVVDLRVFARGREPSFREGVAWSIGWLAVSLAAAGVVWLVAGPDDAGVYTTVYLIERALSLDNLFVFLLLFAYFGVPTAQRARLLFWGIAAALALRGAAILAGVAAIERFEPVLYLLGVGLLVLAWRMFGGVGEAVAVERNPLVRAVRRIYPVADRFHGRRFFVAVDGRRHATPLLLALAGIVFADLAFAIDSIPAAFAVTRDPVLIWMGNIFALLGLRALFVLVDGLTRRLRYMSQTIAVVLAVIAIKLLIEDLVHIGPVVSLAIVAAIILAGIGASFIVDRRRGNGGRAAAKSVGDPIPGAVGDRDPGRHPIGRRIRDEPRQRNGGAGAAHPPARSRRDALRGSPP